MNNLILKVAAKALICTNEGKILLLRESGTYAEGTNMGKYQCPGGRLNAGESYNEALIREIKEETGLAIEPLYPIYVGEWKPVIKGIPHHIIGIFTVCIISQETTLMLSEEHDAYLWIDPFNIPSTIDMTFCDREALKNYVKYAGSNENIVSLKASTNSSYKMSNQINN